ncbi:MAG: aldo/keto reductase [Lachnospiraceae bacterium]|nr:aldo/keto reductase [Lachnospiraceae bacterium]
MPKKKLGFGMMRMPLNNPNDASDVDIEQMCKMVDTFIDRGFTYFDTALMYNGGVSESVVKKVLSSRYPREKFTVATKMHAAFFKSKEEMEEIFKAQLNRTGLEYFDYYLVHGVESDMLPMYEKCDCFRWVLEKKKAGLVKHAGFSFHDTPELLDELLNKYPEMEFVQLQINYLDWESEWIQSKKCYDVAVKHGKQIIVMEPVKGGTLANVPEDVEKLFKDADPDASVPSWAIRFVASLPNVMVVLSGMSSLEQLEDNTGYMSDFKPLTEEEKALCFKAAKIINSNTAIPCTACEYCMGGCPKKIAIPKYFSIYNEDMRENLAEKGWTINFTNYQLLNKEFGKASDCIGCGQCEKVCPQHLPIIENLKKVAAHYE